MASVTRIADQAPRVGAAAPALVVDDIVKRFETPDGKIGRASCRERVFGYV